ncbi:YqhG family protein [Paenibacillus sp. GP183]|jgi:hypothetical protein|uniref:YqhG family protein n=1 Tax=Paenibacillus sp. GP183 TaxID=1882751 RepID=UPI00089A22D5|nr:YqhG family protein [Paenibacillus sp. GP183]SEB74317.1 protein YqhG of unknown function [Paenibacillus sp. GP183]
MNKRHIQTFVMRYLEAFGCNIIEKTPEYVTVKLSPEADKEMTGRSYYWSFVERTGAPAETMTYTFMFESERIKELPQPATMPSSTPPGGESAQAAAGAGNTAAAAVAPASSNDNSILGRYFGFVPTTVIARVPRDEVTFGSRRLEQLFNIVGSKGRFVQLFEVPFTLQPSPSMRRVYETWLNINYKLELTCDMKRSEIHSIAIQLNNGEIRENFHKQLLTKNLTPGLPANAFILPHSLTLPKAVNALELVLERTVSNYDHKWADQANERHQDEVLRIDSYYRSLIEGAELEQREEIETQYLNRRAEIDWQYKPRVLVSVINCGLFHLNSGDRARN